MFEVEKHTDFFIHVLFIHQDRSLLEQSTILLQDKIESHIQQGMTGADQGRLWLALDCDQIFFKDNAFITLFNTGTIAQPRNPITNNRGHILDLIAMRFTFYGTTTQPLERLQEEGTNKIRLQTTRSST